MSSVPTWKRHIDEELKVQTFACKLRVKNDELALRKFWVLDENNVVRKQYRPNPNERISFEEFKWWFVKEKKVLSIMYANLQYNIAGANSIHPYYKSEFSMRRAYHDRTITNIFQIKAELNYIVTVANVDVNKYTEITNDLEEELRMLMSWKKSLNKCKKNLIDL